MASRNTAPKQFPVGFQPPWNARAIFELPRATAGPRYTADKIYQYDSLPDEVDKGKIFTNHFEITEHPDTLERYSIKFRMNASLAEDLEHLSVNQSRLTNKREPRASEKRSVMLKLRDNNLQGQVQWDEYPWVTDYSATIWARKRFPNDQVSLRFNNISFLQENGKTGTVGQVILKWEEQLRFDGDPASLSFDHITAINALTSHIVSGSPNAMRVRANKFYVKTGYCDIGQIAAYRGYFTSARASEDRLLLNVNTVTSPFFKPMLVSKLMTDLPGGYDMPSLLQHLRVRIIYDRTVFDPMRDPNTPENRMKVITGVGQVPSLQKTTTDLTVEQYFKGLGLPTVQCPKLGCINVGNTSKPQWILPELLEIDIEQQFRAPLSAAHTSSMITQALRSPAANAAFIISEGIGRDFLGIRPPQAPLNDLDLSISQQMLQIPLNILAIPRIEYKTKSGTSTIVKLPNDASWNLTNVQVYKPAVPQKGTSEIQVGLLNISGYAIDLNGVKAGMQTQFKLLGMKKVKMASQTHTWVRDNLAYTGQSPLDYETLVKGFFRGLRDAPKDEHLPPGSPLLVVMRTNNKTAYATIKRITDCLMGIQTVFVTAEKMKKLDPQLLANLVIKFNFKLGGINHRVLLPNKVIKQSAFHQIEKTTIVMGADVVHQPQGSMRGCPSVAALVASDDPSFTNFPGHMRLNPARQEIIDDLDDMVLESLRTYYEKNKVLPLNILFYRDGVSEGQYDAVSELEVPKIRKGYNDFRKTISEQPGVANELDGVKIHFVITQKRHHVRFYASDKSQCPQNKDGNVKPGLLVDTHITRPGKPNFYLQSHAALKGTARSAHYVVLYEEIETLTIEQLIDITHAFCYNYARATKGVSYCAPTYYADRLCDRGYHYMRRVYFDNAAPPIAPLVQTTVQSDAGYFQAMKNHIKTNQHWNWEYSLGRKNPWHNNLNNYMFYL